MSHPSFLTKLCFAPKSSDEFELCRPVCFEHDRDDIEPLLEISKFENSFVHAGSPRDLPLLSKIYSGKRPGERIRTFGLYFNEAEHVFIESDKIDLARYLHAAAVAADRDFKVCKHKPVTSFDEIPGSDIFSRSSGFA